MKRLLRVLLVAGLTWSVRTHADSPDAQYVRIYNLIQQADTLDQGGQPKTALEKYLEAQGELKRLQAANPGWNEKVIKFRLNYVSTKLAVSETAAVASTPAQPTPTPAPADRKSTRLNSSHHRLSRMPSSA